MRRLALGTAQFGLTYGVANSAGRVNSAAVSQILARAAAAGVDTLDTAVAYGESESVLGRADVSGWKVISKLPPLPPEIRDVRQWMDDQVNGSLRRLRVTRLDALMLHRPADLLGPHAREYQAGLAAARTQGVTRAVGVSIYDPEELDALWPTWRPEIVQAPLNVLDRRLMTSGWLAKLAAHGVRVHARSVFLQGLLVMSAAQRPAWFAPWSELLDRWLAWCEQQSLSPQHSALGFVDAQSDVERYVIGVDSLAQLEELLAIKPVPAQLPPDDLYSGDRTLLEPSRWKLQ
jgi:aryl-alcohol dehydrogenase-like predicted oxidoreductase